MKEAERTEWLKGTASVPVIVALVALGLTACCWVGALQYIQHRDEDRFKRSMGAFTDVLTVRMNRQIALLNSAKAMVLLNPEITQTEFKEYVQALDINLNYKGTLGLGWIERLTPEQVQDFTRRAGKLEASIQPSNGEIFAILALEPSSNRPPTVVGLNPFQEPLRRNVMTDARDSGEVRMSPLLLPISKTLDQVPIFGLYDPVYNTPETPPADQRQRSFRGFIYSPFKAREFLQKVFEEQSQDDVRVEIFSGTGTNKSNLLYVAGTARSRTAAAYRRGGELEVAGQKWTLVFESTPQFEDGPGRDLLIWIPIAGVLISMLLTALTYRQAMAAQEIADQATELTRKVAQQQLLAKAGDLVNENLDYHQALRSFARIAVPDLADFCVIDMPDGSGEIRPLAMVHRDARGQQILSELAEKFPETTSGSSAVANVLRSGQPVLVRQVDAEMVQGFARNPEHLKLIQGLGMTSIIVVAMIVRTRVVGTIAYALCHSHRPFDEEDLHLGEELAARAGLAIDNSMLFQDAQREKAEVRRLNEQLEDLVRERTLELERSNRELEAFSYSVSHDLRGPLRSVDGFSRAVLDDYAEVLDDTAKGYLNRVRTAARRMDELITSLLKLSRITRASITREPIDVSLVASESAEDARLHSEIPIEIDVQTGMHAVGDGKMLNVVYQNLIGNAVKFSSQSAEPRVIVGHRGKVFFVKDNGVGFNPEYSAKLFAPFERLHSHDQFSGSGIGLATVERIVKRHGGRIWAESKEGEGATFYFTLE